jgi:predicted ATPase/DNA-binding CsgD family transcriptional regulator
MPIIAQTLDIREVTGLPLLERLQEELRQKQMLLLLDNFEQVVTAAIQVGDLLVACPKLKVLVTSREVLHVRAEHEYAVPPLELPDPKHLPDLAALSHYAAVALFLQRAQAVKPDFQITNANARAIAEICARLDGLPLTIELAAARIKLLPPQALLTRLDQRLNVLTSTSRDVPARQQTLRNMLSWSYNLLDAAEQRLFRRLSVFVGGCTLEAIEAVCTTLGRGDEAGLVMDRVASLIDKSLLQQIEQEDQEPRLMMLETIREYGLERLTVNGEMEITRQAHATYYLHLAEEAEREARGSLQAMWLERLEREHDNLRAALSWWLEQGEAGQGMEMALRLGAALEQFWIIRGHLSEGRTCLERALTAREAVSAVVQAQALATAGRLALNQGDIDRGEEQCKESLALYRALGDRAGIALSLQRLAVVAWERNNSMEAHLLTEEALTLWRAVGDKEHVAWALSWLAYMAGQQGEYAKGIALCEESLALYKELESKMGTADTLGRLAEMLYASQSDPARVRSLLEEALALSKELGDKMAIAHSHRLAGRLALSQGNTTMARSFTQESLSLFREIGDRQGTALSLCLLAQVEANQGNHAAARTLYEESLSMAAKGVDDKGLIPSCMEGLANLAAVQGEMAWAARLLGAVQALREAIGVPIWPVDRPGYEHLVADVRTNLGEKSFTAAWAEGSTMTPEQALAAQGPVTLPQPLPTAPSSTPSTKPAATYPDGLTAREVEVLRLIAKGLTNAQVADQLVISPRTVDTHLTAIYSKIQVSSRSAATRYAMEHQLV